MMLEEAETWDDSAMSIVERAAMHEQMRKTGESEQRWNSELPEDGEIDEAEALRITEEALQQQVGVSGETPSGMEREIGCRMEYASFDVSTKVWWIRYVDNVDDYQVMLSAESGTIADISNQGIGFGVG